MRALLHRSLFVVATLAAGAASIAGASLTPAALHAYLCERLPAYMVPLYVELQTEELPKTPTGKIMKGRLREAGTGGAWKAEPLRQCRSA